MLIAAAIAVTAGCQKREPDAPAPATPTPSVTESIDLHNRAVALMGRFDYDGAAKLFQRLLDAAPGVADARVDLAIALLNRRSDGDLSRSAELLDAAIADAPQNLRAKYCRALLHFNAGASAAAKELFEQVAQSDPSDSYAVYYVGQCLFNEGDFDAASERFKRAAELDSYLRSAYYGAFQAAQRLRQRELASESLAAFQQLADNPRARLAELKYTRMGPKAEVRAERAGDPKPQPRPEGPLFAQPAPLPIERGVVDWRLGEANQSPPSITAADINADGQIDLFIAGGAQSVDGVGNVILIAEGDSFTVADDSPLAGVTNVRAALWGDYDDDGLTDVYLCRKGSNQLWRQAEAGEWRDVTAETQTAGAGGDTVDGALYDLDHDGDLDLLLANADGPRQVLNNNRDGAFKPIAEELGIAGDGRGTRRVLLADLDSDDDADIVLVNNKPPHEVYRNDRLWRYEAAAGIDEFVTEPIVAAVARDSNVDGQVELFTIGTRGIKRWSPDQSTTWKPHQIAGPDPISQAGSNQALAAIDIDGDTQLELLTTANERLEVLSFDGTARDQIIIEDATGAFGIVTGVEGPEVIALRSGDAPLILRAGPGRFPFARVRLHGRTDKAAEMRSNASGIGVRGAARIGKRWASIPVWRTHSGPGQNLQPHAIGLAGANKVDFLRLLWPDSVSQTELDLKPGELRTIAETQRQAGSCPLLFVWNGERFDFVADLLGAGGIGFNLGRGEYYDPRPSESFLLPEGSIQPKGERLIAKLGEPMEEVCYFDAVRLVAYDLPPGWRMTLDERFGASPPLPTGQPRFFRRELAPASAINDRGDDVTSAVTHRDGRAAPLGRTDRRFIGMTNPHSVTLTFDRPLDEFESPTLVFDGWVEYAYSQTAFAAWQAGEEYTEPTIEAQGADGRWREVFARFGYPAGTPRQSSAPIPLDALPAGATKLRIGANMQVYWDRLIVVDAEPCPDAMKHSAPLVAASVDDVGYSTRVLHEQRFTEYDYDRRPPLGDCRHPRGFYTAFGDAIELVAETDDAVAIIGPGEELHLEFAAPPGGPPQGWTRRWVIEADGWCKDADLFTKESGSVQPLPRRRADAGRVQLSRRDELHARYNTRYRDGR